MNKKILVGAIAAILSIIFSVQSFADGSESRNHNGWNDNSVRQGNDLQINVGNYRQLEDGQNPVLISPSHDSAMGGSTNPSAGKLSNLGTDTTPILYHLGGSIIPYPVPVIVWYGSWNSNHSSATPVSVTGITTAFGTYSTNSNTISISSSVGAPIAVGQTITGNGVNATITAVNGRTITLSAKTAASGNNAYLLLKTPNATPGDYYSLSNSLLTGLANDSRWKSLMAGYYSKNNTGGPITKTVGALGAPQNYYVATNTSLYGSTLSQSSILKIAQTVTSPVSGSVVLVIPSAEIPVTGFNSGTISFCGWHSWSGSVAYGFVGDAALAPWCQAQSPSTPNNNIGADSMASVLVHELEEATSDPQINAWYSNNGNENADKCAWNFGSFSTNSSPSYGYNYTWNSNRFLIQQEFRIGTPLAGSRFDTAAGSCSLS